MKTTLVFLLYICSFSLSSQSLTIVSITETGEPIISARVAIFDADGVIAGGISNANGIVEVEFDKDINNVIEYSITGNTVEYISNLYTVSGDQLIDVIDNNDTITLEYSLNTKVADELTITGTMLATTIKESPVKTEIVKTKAIEKFIPPTANMVETMRMVNGLTEQVGCGVCFTNSISINGLPGPYTAVLLDGAPVFGNLATVYGLNGIPNIAVEQYEIIKGPNSTLYGSEAMAGIINIITKNPNQSSISFDGSVTSNTEYFANAKGSTNIGNVGLLVAGNYSHNGNRGDINSDGFGDMINFDRYTLFTKADFDIGDLNFKIGANIYDEHRWNGTTEFLGLDPISARGNEEIYGESILVDRYTFFGSVSGNSIFSDRLDVSASIYRQDSYYGSDSYIAEQNMLWANYVYPIKLDRQLLMFGATFRYQDYNDNTQATTDGLGNDITDEQIIPGAFVQHDWRATDELTVLSGARVDHYRRHGPIFSPRLALKYSPLVNLDMRLNAGTGFRIVNLFTEDHAFVTGQRQVVIEEDIMPEQSYNSLLGTTFSFDNPLGFGSLDLDLFYTYFSNKIIPDYETEGQISYSNTDGHAYTRGAAINYRQSLLNDELNLTLGATILQSREVENIDGFIIESDIPYAPSIAGVALLNYYWDWPEINIGLSTRFTGPIPLPDVFDLDQEGNPLEEPRPSLSNPFTIFGLQLQRDFGIFSVFAGAQNIGNFFQELSPLAGYNDPNASPGFSDYFDTAYAFSPIHGREIYLGLRFRAE
ncbi:MAG: TonB-dependent receptor [Candidatus Kapaibacteriales bacterium]